MRILLLTSEPPLPLGHVSARWFYVLVKGLAQMGHQVKILSTCSKQDELKEASELFKTSNNIQFYGFPLGQSKGIKGKIQSILSPGSYQFSSEYMHCFNKLLKESDVIHCEQLVTGIVAAKQKSLPVLMNVHHLHAHDLKNADAKSFYEKIVQKRQIQFEGELIRKFKNIAAVSNELTKRIASFHPEADLTWIPFAMDDSLYTPKQTTRDFQFGLVGNMNWYPSYSAATNVINNIWPKILEKKPDASLLVAGWNARTRLSEFLNVPNLTIKENVKDIRTIFQDIETLIYFPEQGSGVKVKILEAMLMGCAVITNSAGLEGLKVKSGDQLYVTDNVNQVVDYALNLSTNPSLREKIAQAGRQSVLQNHNAKGSLSITEKRLKEILF